MALITCPECEKEVSDKVKTCPHCGYPMSQEAEQAKPSAPQQVEVVSVKVDTQKPKKVLIGIVAAIALIATCAFVVVTMNQKKAADARAAYIENLTLARSTMLTGAAKAETLCNLTKAVWSDTIHEDYNSDTYLFTHTDGKFNEDFNDSLAALYSDSDTLKSVSEIKANQEAVTEIMRNLQNPPDDLASCFETVEAMYDTYSNFTSLAVSPSGSLNSYSENFRTYDNDFMRYYDKLETQIPEK